MPTILHGGVPVSLPKHWRHSAEYQRYRAGLARAKTFREAVRYLAECVADPHRRLYAAADFMPRAPYARKFLNSAAISRRGTENEQFLAIQAQQVLTRLLIATAGGHPREPMMSPNARRAPVVMRAWAKLLTPHWPHYDRLVGAIESTGVILSHSRRLAVRRLVMRAATTRRPIHLTHQLTAWQLGVSVRAVRAACRPRPAVILQSA